MGTAIARVHVEESVFTNNNSNNSNNNNKFKFERTKFRLTAPVSTCQSPPPDYTP